METQVVDELEENADKKEPKHSDHRRRDVPRLLSRVERIPRNNHREIFEVDKSVEDRVSKAGVSFEQIEEAEYVHRGCYDVEKELLHRVLAEIRVLQKNPDEHDGPVRPNDYEDPVRERRSEESEADDSCADRENAPEEHRDHRDI